MNLPRLGQSGGGQRGFSLVEVVVSLAVVALMMGAALSALGASHTHQLRVAQRTQAMLLAQDLLAEILQQSYEDPNAATPIFGLESGESAVAREGFDDVDDYHGLSEAPPVNREGQGLPKADAYTRATTVQWVQVANPTQTAGSESGVKRITITVSRGDTIMASLIAYRTSRWTNPARERGLP